MATKPGGKPQRPRGRRIPDWGKRDHEISHAQAIRMREEYEECYGSTPSALAPCVYDRKIFDRILKQKACYGIRLYPGVNRGAFVIIIVGVDKNGDDILAGIIGETPWRCPPTCSSVNNVLHFG